MIEAQQKYHIKKGDIVFARRGDDAGGRKTGKVLQVLRGEGRAVVEGFNLVKRHTRKSQQNPEGGIIEKEAPIAISNLAIFDEKKEAAAKKVTHARKEAPVKKEAPAAKEAPAKKETKAKKASAKK